MESRLLGGIRRRDILVSYLHNQVVLFRRCGWLGAGRWLAGFTFMSPLAGLAHAKIGYVCEGLLSRCSSPPSSVPTSGLSGAASFLPSGCTSCQLHYFQAHSLYLPPNELQGVLQGPSILASASLRRKGLVPALAKFSRRVQCLFRFQTLVPTIGPSAE